MNEVPAGIIISSGRNTC